MSGEKARDALSQCIPKIFHKNGYPRSTGYRILADELDRHLEARGFKIISIVTYNRLTKEREGDTSSHNRSLQGHEGH